MTQEIKASRIMLGGIESVIKLLERLNINYAVIGGMALQVWGRERVSKDIDIAVDVEEEKLNNLINLFKLPPFNLRGDLQRIGNSLILFVTYEDQGTSFPVNVDLFVSHSEFEAEALLRAEEVEIFGIKLKVITAEDLILYKLIASRPIDIIDIQSIFEENKDIDKAYLKKWSKKLGLEKDLSELC